VVEVVEVVGGLAANAAAVGWNVATKGAWTGVGSTTGTWSTARVTAGVPSWTVTVPLTGTAWTVPAWTSPAHSVDPDEEPPVTDTQHVPVPVTVIV
jgi:hypothetical protein